MWRPTRECGRGCSNIRRRVRLGGRVPRGGCMKPRQTLHTTPDPQPPLRWVFIGLSITSSWGNGHATTYRGLIRELVRRGHDVLFLEHDKPWYAVSRDMPNPPFGRTRLYSSVDELKHKFQKHVRD